MSLMANFLTRGFHRLGLCMAIAILGGVDALDAKDPTVWVIEGTEENQQLGRSICVVGDLDGDGVKDFAASSEYAPVPNEGPGKITLHSGKDGKIIRTIFGIAPLDDLGRIALSTVPDLDGDGIPELYSLLLTHGFVVLSPVSGNRWYQVEKYISFGTSIGPRGTMQWIEDLDGDGIQDFVGGTPTFRGDGPEKTRIGVVTAFSTRTGTALWESFGREPHAEFGSTVLAVSDFDRDGTIDLMATEDDPGMHGPNAAEVYSRIWILSGRTGERIRSYNPPQDHYFGFGLSMASLGDLDGDAFPEVAIGAPYYRDFFIPRDGNGREEQSRRRRGWAGVYKFPEGTILFDLEGLDSNLGAFDGDQLGIALASPGDWNSDGIADLLVGTERSTDKPVEFGRLYLVSGRGGKVLATYEVNNSSVGSYTNRIIPLADVDSDSMPEVLISRQFADGIDSGVPGVLRNTGRIFALGAELAGPVFLRGDANSDGRVNLADAVSILLLSRGHDCLRHLEPGQTEPSCLASYDIQADGCVNWTDALLLVWYLFEYQGGPVTPSPPFPACGQFSRIEESIYNQVDCQQHAGCKGLAEEH